MEVRCTCPYCAGSFTIEVKEPEAPEKPKQKRNVSEEARAQRAERMRQMRLAGIGGRPKGSKNKQPRKDKGVERGGRHDMDTNIEWVEHDGQEA
jgi:hypothetical protein